jgi:hypothetical protein
MMLLVEMWEELEDAGQEVRVVAAVLTLVPVFHRTLDDEEGRKESHMRHLLFWIWPHRFLTVRWKASYLV